MASSAPSPMTTVPSMAMTPNAFFIASIAARSAAASSPRPMKRPEASAAASVTRTTSIARLRSMPLLLPADALEDPVRLGDEDALIARVALAEAALDPARLLLVVGDIDRERDRLGARGAGGARRRVVGGDKEAPGAAALAEPLEQRVDHLLVEALDGRDLPVRVAEQRGGVRGLHMDDHEVVALERAQALLDLAPARGQVREAGQEPGPDRVRRGGDDGAGDAETRQRLQRRMPARAPRP